MTWVKGREKELYSREERQAIRARVKEMLQDDSFRGDLGKPDYQKMEAVLSAEGFRRPNGEPLERSHIGNLVQVVRGRGPNRKKATTGVKTLYEKKATIAAGPSPVLSTLRILIEAGLDDKTLGATARKLILAE